MHTAEAVRAKLRDVRTLADPWPRARAAPDTGQYIVIVHPTGDVTVHRDVGAAVPEGGQRLDRGRAAELVRASLERVLTARVFIAPADARALRLTDLLAGRGVLQGLAVSRGRAAVRRPAPPPPVAGRRGRVPREPRTPRAARAPRLPRPPRPPRAPRRPRAPRVPRRPRPPRAARPARAPRLPGTKRSFRLPYCVRTWQPHLEAVATAGCEWFETEAHRMQAQLNPRFYVVPAEAPGCSGCLSSECSGPFSPILRAAIAALGVPAPPPPAVPTRARTLTERRNRQRDLARRAAATAPAPPPRPPAVGAGRLALWERVGATPGDAPLSIPARVWAVEEADIQGLYGAGGRYQWRVRCIFGEPGCQ